MLQRHRSTSVVPASEAYTGLKFQRETCVDPIVHSSVLPLTGASGCRTRDCRLLPKRVSRVFEGVDITRFDILNVVRIGHLYPENQMLHKSVM